MGTKLLMGVLLALLTGSLVVGYVGWTGSADADIPSAAYVVLFVGVIITLLVGCGLMALVFYSNRKGYDEQAHLGTEHRKQ